MLRQLLPLTLSTIAVHAAAQGSGIERCPAIADPMARLACYDAAMPPVSARATPTAGPQAAPPAARAATPSTPAAAPPAPPPPARADFGLPPSQPATAERIESTTAANFYGWGPKERIKLQNGQVWEVTDGSSGTLGAGNTKVTVRKGLFGSFVMEFEGLNRSPKVRRVE